MLECRIILGARSLKVCTSTVEGQKLQGILSMSKNRAPSPNEHMFGPSELRFTKHLSSLHCTIPFFLRRDTPNRQKHQRRKRVSC